MIKKTLLAILLLASQPFAAMAADTADSAGLAGALAGQSAMADETGSADGRENMNAFAAPNDESTAPSAQTAEQAGESSSGQGNVAEGADKPGGASGEGVSPDEGQWIGIVTLKSGNLNVRKGPSLEDEIIGKLPNGTVIPVLEQFSEWVSIRYGGGIAYVAKSYLVLKKVDKSSGTKVIVLDPGHGGKDPGAMLKDGTKEADIVWEYAVKAKEALEKAGYVVHLTRDKDRSCTDYTKSEEDLACRAEFASKVGGDIFISIHADSNPVKSFRGTVTFYNARNDYDGMQNPYPEKSRRLAQLVHTQVQPVMGSRDRGVANRNYYVNRMNTVPSVLLELAVLTNNNDLKLLKSGKRKDAFAQALVKAVDLYFQSETSGEEWS